MSSSLEHKLDLLLSLVHDHGARLRRLEEKIEPGVAKFSKYVSCSQLGQMVGLQGRTITKYINRGKFPKEILKKKSCGQNYQWRIDKEKGLEILEKISLWEDFND